MTTKSNPKPPNHNKRWTDKDVQKIEDKAKQGVPTPKIALDLGRTEDAVRDKAKEEDISLKPKDQQHKK